MLASSTSFGDDRRWRDRCHIYCYIYYYYCIYYYIYCYSGAIYYHYSGAIKVLAAYRDGCALRAQLERRRGWQDGGDLARQRHRQSAGEGRLNGSGGLQVPRKKKL
jgi:hypothetical protein